MTFDDKTLTLVVPFEYRLQTDSELVRYGRNAKGQEAILDEAAPKMLKKVKDDVLASALSEPSPTGREAEGEEPPTLLRRRLSHFTKKNTTDYFVHKNLGGFLRQELEFFIRDQIVHEADLEGDFDVKRRMLRVFRKLADTVITFLAQIEGAQKRLFEKKKFILRTDYLIPIQNVPRDLLKDVLANKAQLNEWKALFALQPESGIFNLKGKINEYFLEQNPTLVVDTRHFTPEFIAQLLEAVVDLDQQTDGVLIHGENFQALSLMREPYREQVKCVYIDPPYNTGSDDFIYKDNYQHSSWLTMLVNRCVLARELLRTDGAFFSHIDDNEFFHLRLALDSVLGCGNFLCAMPWIKRYGPPPDTKDIGYVHEMVLAYRASERFQRTLLPLTEEQKARYKNVDNDQRGPWKLMDYTCRYTADERPNLYYPIVNPNIGSEVWPKRSRVWAFSKEEHERHVRENRIWWGNYGKNTVPALKNFLTDIQQGMMPTTVLQYDVVGHTDEAAKELRALIPGLKATPKPTRLMRYLGLISTDENSCVLDFFAGSGTTGHAVINLNREYGGHRKFILVEVADYFDTVLVPRIKKVMFTPDWKDGKPKRLASKEEAERTPRLVKVLRLESYEDALHNTFSEKAIESLAKREEAYRESVGDGEYRIRYMVKLPLEASDSMLNLAKLEHPFDYIIEVLTDYGPKSQTVDLVETFNWIYGLRIRRMLTWTNPKDKTGKEEGGRVYRAVLGADREGKKRVLVVWRDMTGLDPVTDREFLESKSKEFGPFEEQWVNGDSAAKGFASLDGLFRRLMAGDEV